MPPPRLNYCCWISRGLLKPQHTHRKYHADRPPPRHSWARTWKGVEEWKTPRVAGLVGTSDYQHGPPPPRRATTAEVRVARRGHHRNSYGGFLHKRQEKPTGYGGHVSADEEAKFRVSLYDTNMAKILAEAIANPRVSHIWNDPYWSVSHTRISMSCSCLDLMALNQGFIDPSSAHLRAPGHL